MRAKYLFLVIISFFSFLTNAQKTNEKSSKKSISIYTFSHKSDATNNFSTINEKLNLSNFDFIFVEITDLDLNQFSVETKNSYKTLSKFTDDDIKRYQNKNLLKGFLLKNDPTRWNLQCQQTNLYTYN